MTVANLVLHVALAPVWIGAFAGVIVLRKVLADSAQMA